MVAERYRTMIDKKIPISFMIVDKEGKTNSQLKAEVLEKVTSMFNKAIKEELGKLDKSMPGYDEICKAVIRKQNSEMKNMLNQFNTQIDEMIPLK